MVACEASQHIPELSLIIMLGWHLLVDDYYDRG
jgi:hypothetical protein